MQLIKGFQKLSIEKDVITTYNVLIGQIDQNFRKIESEVSFLQTEKPSGTAVLVAGLVTVNDPRVRVDSIIMLTSQVDGGAPGFLRVQTLVEGSSFNIRSSSATDTSTVGWIIIN